MRLLVLLALLPLAGCFSAGCEEGRDGDEMTFCVDGPRRVVAYDVPNPERVIVALHSAGGGADQFAATTQLHTFAAAHNMSVWYAEGVGRGQTDAGRTWNAVHCCGASFREGAADEAFLLKVLQAAPGPVALVGHSNGAMMAYKLAGAHPGVTSHVAAVGGTIGGAPTADGRIQVVQSPPAGSLSVLVIHALDDAEVPYDGGVGEGNTRYDVGVNETAEFWRQAGASVDVVPTRGGHGWPGATGPPGPDASQIIVEWLS